MQVVNLSLRGAGASEGAGSWGGDAGEVQDVVSAAAYARDTLRARHVHLLGYSFGATVCGAALDACPCIATYIVRPLPSAHDEQSSFKAFSDSDPRAAWTDCTACPTPRLSVCVRMLGP